MSTKSSTATPLKLTLTGAELPANWADQAGVAADEQVEVIIRPDRNAAAKRLLASTQRMRQQAKQTGLTEEKLTALIHDDD